MCSQLSAENPDVTVIIPNLDGMEHLPDCMDSLSKLSYPGAKLHILVVDNNSSDDSVNYLNHEHPGVEVIQLAENEGFARAINYGVTKSKTEFVAFLNNDMRVDKKWLQELTKVLDPENKILCAGSQILDWDGGVVDYSGGHLNFCGYGISLRRGEPVDSHPENKTTESTLFPCGGAMIIEKKLFLDMGGFDPQYFAYYEDVDLGLRLWLNGYQVHLARKSRVNHKGFGTGKRLGIADRHFLWHRNALFTIFKNFEDDTLKKVFPAVLFLAADRGLNFLEYNKTGKDFLEWLKDENGNQSLSPEQKDSVMIGYSQLRAISEFLHALPELIPQRLEIQENRVRSDREIFDGNRLSLDFADMVDLPRYDIFHAKLLQYFDIGSIIDKNKWKEFNLVTLQKLDAYILDRLKHIKNLERQVDSLMRTSATREAENKILSAQTKNLEKTVKHQEEFIKSLQLFESKVKSSFPYRIYRRIKDMIAPATGNS